MEEGGRLSGLGRGSEGGKEVLGREEQYMENLAPPDLQPLSRAFQHYAEALDSMATERWAQNRITLLLGYFLYLKVWYKNPFLPRNSQW